MLNRALTTIPCALCHRLLVPMPAESETSTDKDLGTPGRTRWRGCVP